MERNIEREKEGKRQETDGGRERGEGAWSEGREERGRERQRG